LTKKVIYATVDIQQTFQEKGEEKMKRPKSFSKATSDFVEKTVGKNQSQEVGIQAQQKKRLVQEGRKLSELGPGKSGPH
jgi:hypothetical protein